MSKTHVLVVQLTDESDMGIREVIQRVDDALNAKLPQSITDIRVKNWVQVNAQQERARDRKHRRK